MKKIVCFCCLVVGLSSCRHERQLRPITPDSFIFGISYGFCGGDCAQFYLLQQNYLYGDNMLRYQSPPEFKMPALSHENSRLAKTLLDSLPHYLEEHPDTSFGCPDCMDQGAIRLELTKNGSTRYWNLDLHINSLPEALRSYAKQVQKTVDSLRVK